MRIGSWGVLGWWVCTACGTQPPPETQAADAARHVAARITSEVDCERSISRYLCLLDGLDGGIPVPTVSQTLIGLTVAIDGSVSVEESALDRTTLASLRIDGDRAWLDGLAPSDAAQAREVGAVVSNVSMVLKQRADGVRVSEGLEAFLGTPRGEGRPLRRDAAGLWIDGPSPARVYAVSRSGAAADTIAVVSTEQDRAVVSLFPIVERRVTAPNHP